MKNQTITRQIVNISIFILLVMSLPGCATIFTKSKYPITVSSEPQGAEIAIMDETGWKVATGTTPFTVTLDTSSKMGKALYTVRASLNGYEEKTDYIEYKTDGWYYANLALPVLGWFIGMPFIEPASGAMWKPKSSNLNIIFERANTTQEAE